MEYTTEMHDEIHEIIKKHVMSAEGLKNAEIIKEAFPGEDTREVVQIALMYLLYGIEESTDTHFLLDRFYLTAFAYRKFLQKRN